MAKAAFVYSDDFVRYKFSDHHPLQQRRIVMLKELLDAYGVFDNDNSVVVSPTAADPADVARIHSPDYLDAMRRLSENQFVPGKERYGFSGSDNPPFPGMWEASLLYCGASVNAVELVLSGRYRYAFNSSGGLHHASRDRGSGFCLLNDCALAAQAALDRGVGRVAYVDIDAHHGDGTQSIFYGDPRVLTVSIHETGRTLFPGTGFAGEIGEGDGTGFAINVPMAPYSTDDQYAYAFESAIEPILRAYDAEFYIVEAGADAHVGDPLTHMQLSSYGWMSLIRRMLAAAGDKPLIVLGGGGYDVNAAVRLWTMVYTALAGIDVPNETPAQYAKATEITNLHDQPHQRPVIARDEYDLAWEYVKASVEQLKRWVGDRYGL